VREGIGCVTADSTRNLTQKLGNKVVNNYAMTKEEYIQLLIGDTKAFINAKSKAQNRIDLSQAYIFEKKFKV
jgi:hypothetical protein